MKQTRLKLFLAAFILMLISCGEADSGLLDVPPPKGDTTGKKGGGSGENVAGLSVEFKTQGGSWLSQDIPEGFWDKVINDDATVNLPSAYIQRGGMILVGWYDRAQPLTERALTAYKAVSKTENGKDDTPSLETESEEEKVKIEPFLLSSEAVPEEGRFTETTKLTKNLTVLYAWWQQIDENSKIVSFIPYWTEGAQGFKRQAIMEEGSEPPVYKIPSSSFPKVSDGPEHHHAIGVNGQKSDTTWFAGASDGEAFTVDSVVEDNMTVYGRWAIDKVKVKFHVNGAEAGAGDAEFEKEADYGGPVTLEAGDTPQAAGEYSFLGWLTERKGLITSEDEIPTLNYAGWFKPGETLVTKELDVYGLWDSKPAGSYRVIFKSYYETENQIKTVYALPANGYKVVSLPEGDQVTRQHYTRDTGKWYYTPAIGGKGDSTDEFTADTEVIQDIIVYAKWTGNKYSVEFKRLNGDSQTKSVTYPMNKLAAANIPIVGERANYESDGKWYVAGLTEFNEDYEIVEDVTVSPKWFGKTYTVTFNGNGGNANKTSTTVKYPDNDMTLNPTMSLGENIATAVKVNYSFDGWFNGNDKVEKTTQIKSSITVTAKWTFTGYVLTFDGDGATITASPASKTVTGTNNGPNGVVVGALPGTKPKKTNYLFDGWYTAKNGGGTKVDATTSVTSDNTYYANWVAVPIADGWTYNSDTGGMSKNFKYTGDVQSFKTIVNEGEYTFEIYGASGGYNYHGRTGSDYSNAVGKGGYAKGTITSLSKNITLYVYVGGQGKNSAAPQEGANIDTTGGAGGWNGGGKGGDGSKYNDQKQNKYPGGGGGGGATDIRLEKNVLNTRIIVAGGGGGAGQNSTNAMGGDGGGANGGAGKGMDLPSKINVTVVNGATQTTGYKFGEGQAGGNGNDANCSAEGHGGGGGGYWGGNAKTTASGERNMASGAGGSGFVYGYTGTPGVTSGDNWIPGKYQQYKFTKDMACTSGKNSGNGKATVTYKP
ncbi:MAG: InlB B-repeat-containing protein [Spirochaetaceae bacterium]|jgi:uncharacterized repeat protein (TIGR02543 family)|nr:InlB B-repeat-containing protein [Spirochaetaceae bacterium]